MSDTELKDKFGEGSAILRPSNLLIAEKKGKFLFVPLFFYTVFKQWADRADTTAMVVESTYDPTHPVAKKARDSKQWTQPYEEDLAKDPGDQRKYRFVEHLCFVGIIYDGDFAGERCLISFQKGDFFVGRGFATGAQMRKVTIDDQKKTVPLWAQVWEMTIALRDKNGNKWWGFDPGSPPDGIEPIIDADHYEAHAAAYAELAEAHKNNTLRIDGEEDDPDEKIPNSGDGEF